MPSFNIFGSSSTSQNLEEGEKGFVGPNGVLVTSGLPDPSISMSESTNVVILGAVVSQSDSCIEGNVGSFGGIVVGATGQVIASTWTAIGISFSGVFQIDNNGLISAQLSGIAVEASDSAGIFDFRNTGTITAATNAVNADTGSGTFDFVNTGVIATESTSIYDAVSIIGGEGNFRNSGTIIGDVRIVTGTGTGATIVNTGLIDGAIILGDGNDSFENLGGRVTGTVNGGAGDDTYRIDDGSIVVIDGSGTDAVFASVTYNLGSGIERLFLTGTADIRGYGTSLDNQMFGNAGDNRISGNRGDDSLLGADGNDTLRGGAGNDTLSFDGGDDVLNGGSGIDTFNLGGSSLSANVNLTTGVTTGDQIDTDTLEDIENVVGSSAADIITGSKLANDLQGGNGDDVISGASGNDTLTGGSGADTLIGGNGADSFVYTALANSTPATPDRITDFVPGTDIIDLSRIDANGVVLGEGSFTFGGIFLPPEGTAGVSFLQDAANNQTIVSVRDTVGAAVDLRIVLTGFLALTATDFAL